MTDLIIIAGSPGSGKSTVSGLLHKKLGGPYIEFGHLRQMHLDANWTNASPIEEQMSFESLIFFLKNYRHYGYKNIIVTDLEDYRVQQIPGLFPASHYVIITLFISTFEELKARVLNPDRDSGYRNYEAAWVWNQAIQDRELLPNEHRLDNSHNHPVRTVARVISLLNTNE